MLLLSDRTHAAADSPLRPSLKLPPLLSARRSRRRRTPPPLAPAGGSRQGRGGRRTGRRRPAEGGQVGAHLDLDLDSGGRTVAPRATATFAFQRRRTGRRRATVREEAPGGEGGWQDAPSGEGGRGRQRGRRQPADREPGRTRQGGGFDLDLDRGGSWGRLGVLVL